MKTDVLDGVLGHVARMVASSERTLEECKRVLDLARSRCGEAGPRVRASGRLVYSTEGGRLENATIATFEGGATARHYVANIDFGDGTPVARGRVVTARTQPGFAVLATHTYSMPGEFVASVQIEREAFVLARTHSSVMVGRRKQRVAADLFERVLGRAPAAKDREFIDHHADADPRAMLRALVRSREHRESLARSAFRRFLNREPEMAELERATSAIEAGRTLALNAELVCSPEFFSRSCLDRASDFARQSHLALLGRTPDADELEAALASARDAEGRKQLVARLVETPAARAKHAHELANRYAGRSATIREVLDAAQGNASSSWEDSIHGGFELRPQDFPGEPGDLPQGAVADFAVQSFGELPEDERMKQENLMVEQVTSQLHISVYPGSYSGNGSTIVAIWLEPISHKAKQAWFERTSIFDDSIRKDRPVGFFVSQAFMKRAAETALGSAPVPEGAEITGVDVVLETDGSMITKVSGVQTLSEWFGNASFDFTVSITDRVSRDPLTDSEETVKVVDCAGTSYKKLKVVSSKEVDKKNVTAGLVFIGILTDGLFGLSTATQRYEVLRLYMGGTGDFDGGVGAGIIANLPSSQLIPGGKIMFNLDQVIVDPTGIVVRGELMMATRNPKVTIQGPQIIPRFKYGPTPSSITLSPVYEVHLCDMRVDDTTEVHWSATDHSVVSSPDALSTKIQFQLPASPLAVGESVTQRVGVRVGPDLDNNTIETEITVKIEMFERLPVAPDAGPPARPLEL